MVLSLSLSLFFFYFFFFWQEKVGTYSIAKRHQMPLQSNHLQVSVKRGLAHAVKDGIHAVPARNLIHPRHYVVPRAHRPLGAELLGQVALFLRAGRANHLCPEAPEHLDEQLADTAGGGVHKRPLAGLDVAGLADEGPRREALQEGGGGLLRRQAGRDGDELGRRDGRVLRVGLRVHVHDSGADWEGCDVLVVRDDLAGGLAAEDDGEVELVQAAAEVGVDEVDACELVLDEDLALLGGGYRHVFVVEDVDAAGLGDLDGLHCGWDGGHAGRFWVGLGLGV